MAVADALRPDATPQTVRQALHEGPGEEGLRLEGRETAFLFRECDRGLIGRVAHEFQHASGKSAAFRTVIGRTLHDQRIGEARDAEPDAPAGARLIRLRLQRIVRSVQHIVEKAHRDCGCLFHAFEIERDFRREWVAHETGQVDRTEITRAIGRQRHFSAGIAGMDRLGIAEIVQVVDPVDEQNARFAGLVGCMQDRGPQLPCPQDTDSLAAEHERPVGVFIYGADEIVGDEN